jgi:heme/copper-type cytochrome/quinol oxidase subunit 2
MKRPLRVGLAASLVLAATIALLAPGAGGGSTPAERTFRIEASRFAYSPAVIAVNPGDRVNIELVATDVVHGLYIEGYDLSLTADPGQTSRLSFVADRPGSFRLRCSVACGALHPFMIGKLKVGPNRLLWRAIGLAALATVAAVLATWR